MDTSGGIFAQGILNSEEALDDEMARRVPDIMISLDIPTLKVGKESTITWKQLSYQTEEVYTTVYRAYCTTNQLKNHSCGNSTSEKYPPNGNEWRSIGIDIAPYKAEQGNWDASEAQSIIRTYSLKIKPTTAGKLVLRLYHLTAPDLYAGRSPLALWVSGKLPNTGKTDYFDTAGVRILTEVSQ